MEFCPHCQTILPEGVRLYEHEDDCDGCLDYLAEALIQLDMKLTGQPEDFCKKTCRDQEFGQRFADGDDVYYLSDGGYSRLTASWDATEVYLTSNSLDSTRERWDDARHEVADVVSQLREYRE